MSDIYTVSCKGFKFTHGEPAYCYGTEEGDIEIVLKELFQYLQSVGYDVTIPTYYEDDYDAHVEENTYYNQFVYGNGFITYLHENGIEVKTSTPVMIMMMIILWRLKIERKRLGSTVDAES